MRTLSIRVIVLASFSLLCAGCAEGYADGPCGLAGGSRFAASMETPRAIPHATEAVAAREPVSIERTLRHGGELVQCAQCR